MDRGLMIRTMPAISNRVDPLSSRVRGTTGGAGGGFGSKALSPVAEAFSPLARGFAR